MLRRVQRVPLAACPPVPQQIAPYTDTGRQAASGTPPPIVSWTLSEPARLEPVFLPWEGYALRLCVDFRMCAPSFAKQRVGIHVAENRPSLTADRGVGRYGISFRKGGASNRIDERPRGPMPAARKAPSSACPVMHRYPGSGPSADLAEEPRRKRQRRMPPNRATETAMVAVARVGWIHFDHSENPTPRSPPREWRGRGVRCSTQAGRWSDRYWTLERQRDGRASMPSRQHDSGHGKPEAANRTGSRHGNPRDLPKWVNPTAPRPQSSPPVAAWPGAVERDRRVESEAEPSAGLRGDALSRQEGNSARRMP